MRVSDAQGYVLDKLSQGYQAVVYYDDARAVLKIPGCPGTCIRVRLSTVRALKKKKLIATDLAASDWMSYKLARKEAAHARQS